MRRASALVCGAGPAGVTTAFLHRSSCVLVLDSNPFFKPCGELVLKQEADAMGAEVMRRSSLVEVRTPYGSREFNAETAMIDKVGWMEKMLERSGAELVRTRVKRPIVGRGRCEGVVAGGEEYRGEVTYDCTGASRALASFFSPTSEREYATCYEETIPDNHQFDHPLAYYDEKLAGGGYLWLFPKGDGTMYAGLATWPWLGSLKERLQLFKKRMGIGSDNVIDRKGSRIFVGLPRQPKIDRLAIVGEANGSCDPYTGSGIFQAVTDARKQFLGEERKSGFLRKLSAFALRSLPAAYLQALEAVPVPFVQFYP